MKKIWALFRRFLKTNPARKELLPCNNREIREAIRKKDEALYLLYDIVRCNTTNK